MDLPNFKTKIEKTPMGCTCSLGSFQSRTVPYRLRLRKKLVWMDHKMYLETRPVVVSMQNTDNALWSRQNHSTEKTPQLRRQSLAQIKTPQTKTSRIVKTFKQFLTNICSSKHTISIPNNNDNPVIFLNS